MVTSGIAGVFPPGLPIGTVAATDDVSPAVKINVERSRLEYVRVVNYGMAMHVDPPITAKQLGASKRANGEPDLRADAQ